MDNSKGYEKGFPLARNSMGKEGLGLSSLKTDLLLSVEHCDKPSKENSLALVAHSSSK